MITALNPGGIECKAEHLLAAGYVEVIAVDANHTVIDVRSTTTPDLLYRVRSDQGGAWQCSCIAGQHRRRCSHMAAAQMITAPPGRRRLRPTTTTAASQ